MSEQKGQIMSQIGDFLFDDVSIGSTQPYVPFIAVTGQTLTRAVFDTLDVDNNNTLTAAEIDYGLRELTKEGDYVDCVTIAVAKKVAREMGPHEKISMRDFEARALAAMQGLTDPNSDKAYFYETEREMMFSTHEQFP